MSLNRGKAKASSVQFGSNFGGLIDPFSGKLGGFSGDWGSGSVSVSQSLVLDSERSELIHAPRKLAKKAGVSEAKAIAAMKSHSEAERRRRERINAHLDTLRGLVPCTEKMDKATLLAVVVSQVKQLKKTAIEASKGLLIPVDGDEVKVEPLGDSADGRSFRATICCDYKPDLLSDLRQALDSLDIHVIKAEISTLGGRVKNVFVFMSDRMEGREQLASSVHQALSSVLDKFNILPEYSPRTTLLNKKRRFSYFDSSSSSS